MQSSLALTLASLPAVASPARTVPHGPHPPTIGRVVYDARHALARAFGDRAGYHGVERSAVRASVHALWHDDLALRLREAPASLAGITDFSALLVLEMMVAEFGLRVAFRAHHRALGADRCSTELFGAASLTTPLAASCSSGEAAQVGARLADFVVAFPPRRRGLPGPGNLVAASSRTLRRDDLVTWILVPAHGDLA